MVSSPSLIWELTAKNPVVDLSLFKGRNFALGTLAFCLGYAVFFANNLLMPLWLQTQVGYTATWAGLVAAPTGVIAVLLTPLSAKLMTKIDARIIASVAFIAFAVSFLMRARFTNEASFLDFTLPLLVQGVATATFFLAMITILLDGIPPQKIPLASAFQLRPHHRRRHCRFHRHHSGPARGAASSRLADQTTIFTRASPGLEGSARFRPFPAGGQAAVTRTMISQAYLLAATTSSGPRAGSAWC